MTQDLTKSYVTADGTELNLPDDNEAKFLVQKYDNPNRHVEIYKVGNSKNIVVKYMVKGGFKVYYFRRTLTMVIIGILLLGLSGCSQKKNSIVTAAAKTLAVTGNKADSDNKINPASPANPINLANLKFILPASWVKSGNESEISFLDENKQTTGGISIVGYYGNYDASLPNHSEILDTEDIESELGKGRLYTLERSNPAASNNPETWNEIHAIIPIDNNNMAYDIWVNVNKDTLLNIIKSIH